MTVDEWPEWLPADWIIQISRIDELIVKCYIDPNGQTCYSKAQVELQLKNNTVNEKTQNDDPTLDISLDPDIFTETNEDPESTPQGQSTRLRRHGSNGKTYKESEDGFPSERDPRGRKENDDSWLPEGWSVEYKTKSSGKKYKIFIDPNGKKLFSKPQIMKYLGSNEVMIPMENDYSWLPEGWNMEVKTKSSGQKFKVFISPNGKKLFSRPQVMKYLGSNEEFEDGSSQSRSLFKDDSWLPEGWNVEVKAKHTGQKYKVYIDPNGKKLFSRPQVMKHLGITYGQKTSTELIEATEVETSTFIECAPKPPDYEVISSNPAEGLPPGWIEEIRMNLQSNKEDPYFIDPLSGYVFFSKMDALKYLETGDIKKCETKPLRRNTRPNNQEIVEMNEGEVALLPEPSKESETSKSISNGHVRESTTNGSATEKRKVRTHFISPVTVTDEAWLPNGWVVEFRHRDNGSKVKCFRELATDKKCYSKPQVLAYLGIESDHTNSPNSKMRKVSEIDYE